MPARWSCTLRTILYLTWAAQGLLAAPARAEDRPAATRSEIVAALDAARAGDRILIAPGHYAGGLYKQDLADVTLRGADPADPPVIEGGAGGIQLSDATGVTIEHLIIEGAAGNGINVDDGGTFATPSTAITIRDVVVRDLNPSGNNVGIKASGVTGLLIEGVKVYNWGDAGDGIDLVGSHDVLIQNSLFRHTSGAARAMQIKGGSKNVIVRANRIELPIGKGRALQVGGVTGVPYFRFIDGDSGYEAARVTIEGNVIIGASSALAWVNIDGGVFHHNFVKRPGEWVFRILNENQGRPIVQTQYGVFTDNVIVFNDRLPEWRSIGNYGPGVLEDTFTFARNHWFNPANPTAAGSTPQLPAIEANGTYGDDPAIDIDRPIVWRFPWGVWLVNAAERSGRVDLEGLPLVQGVAGQGGQFDPQAAAPLRGAWTFEPLSGPTLELAPFTQAILIDPAGCPACDPSARRGTKAAP
jgi:Right handed beta helix region